MARCTGNAYLRSALLALVASRLGASYSSWPPPPSVLLNCLLSCLVNGCQSAMSETLLCILLVSSSAKGSNLIYHWPPSCKPTPRLARPLPTNDFPGAFVDNPWRAANSPDNPAEEPSWLDVAVADRKSTRLNSSHSGESRMPSSA